MDATKKDHEALSMLMAAALALPGMAACAADPDVRGDSIALSYNRGQYAESGRMSVDTDQLSLTAPIGDRYEVKLNAIRDITSGASPFSNILVNGRVMQIKSAASIREQRNVVDVTGAYYGDAYRADVNLGRSIENDYKASFTGANYRRYFNDKTTNLTLGAAFSEDTTWEKFYPQHALKPSPYNERRRHDLSIAVSQILDANSFAEFSLTHSYSYGFLNDQYRRPAVITGFIPNFVADSRPREHTQVGALARYSRYFAHTHSALHLDYRFVHDSWGADSHTLEGKWRCDLGNGWIVAPGLRYYTQKSAAFYDLYFTKIPDNQLLSSDYRLAGFGALAPKLELVKHFKNSVSLSFSYENYIRKRRYRLSSGSRGDPIDDYRAKLLSLSIEGAF